MASCLNSSSILKDLKQLIKLMLMSFDAILLVEVKILYKT